MAKKPIALPQPTIEFDLEAAAKFLKLLDPVAQRWTFQTWDDVVIDDKPRGDNRLARVLHGTLDEHAEALIDLNRRGAAVAVTMNETDLQGTKNANIKRIRALKLDLDGAPLAPVDACPLQPHIEVESSPDRYHAYWLVSDFVLGEFQDSQKAVAKRFDGDEQVALLTHRARLPGFYHMKREPFLVRLVTERAHAPFASDDINAEFPPLKTSHKAKGSLVILPVGVPVEAARRFAACHFFPQNVQGLYYYRGSFYDWRGTHFAERDPEDIRARLYEFLDSARVEKDGILVPFNPTSSKVNQTLDALRSGAYLDRESTVPFWRPPYTDRKAENLIACRNGLLDITTGELTPHDPHFFNVNCLPFDFDAAAPTYPPRWMEFLRQLWPGDKGSDGQVARFALQEIFGLALTPETHYQKIFMIVGPPRSGKGTIARVLEALLGRNNVDAPTLSGLSSHFGLSSLIDKRMGVISDARLGARTDAHTVAERLLSISGEDFLTIDRKHRDPWSGRLSVRFLILTNELPRIVDASGALPSRFVLLTLTNSFLGKEDLRLTEKLLAELPGILRWSLKGLERLHARGYFVMPESSLAAIQQLEDLASPVSAFLRECCEVGGNRRIEKELLYAAWKEWCDRQGQKTGSQIVFGRSLCAAHPHIHPTHSNSRRFYAGVELAEKGPDEGLDEVRMRGPEKRYIYKE